MWQRLFGFVLLAGLLSAQTNEDAARAAMNRGVAAFKQAHYAEAVAEFEQATRLAPENTNAYLYLGTAFMVQWIPGAQSAENDEFARRAEAAFRMAHERDRNDKTAVASLASLAFNRGKSVLADEVHIRERMRYLDEAQTWYSNLAEIDPNDKTAYYSLGVIAWERFYPALMQVRVRLGMRPEDPGPLPDANERVALRNQYGAIVEQGMANLTRALEIDPGYDDAMAYLNLLYRERADYRDTVEDAQRDIAAADALVARALDARKRKAENPATGDGIVADAPAPSHSQPMRLRIGGNVQAANLITMPEPVYPPLARQARVQGTVRFRVIVGRDGQVQNVQLVSGHPLLVPAATEAVKGYVYKPTLLNGQPVEVITQVDVNFRLTN